MKVLVRFRECHGEDVILEDELTSTEEELSSGEGPFFVPVTGDL